MYDEDESETAEDCSTPPVFCFPDQLFNEDDDEDNLSYVRGYN